MPSGHTLHPFKRLTRGEWVAIAWLAATAILIGAIAAQHDNTPTTAWTGDPLGRVVDGPAVLAADGMQVRLPRGWSGEVTLPNGPRHPPALDFGDPLPGTGSHPGRAVQPGAIAIRIEPIRRLPAASSLSTPVQLPAANAWQQGPPGYFAARRAESVDEIQFLLETRAAGSQRQLTESVQVANRILETFRP